MGKENGKKIVTESGNLFDSVVWHGKMHRCAKDGHIQF
jgi:hypothetical protein